MRRQLSNERRPNDEQLYAGFHNKNIQEIFNFDTTHDEAFQSTVKVSSYGRKVNSPKMLRLQTGAVHSGDTISALARPSTAVRPVGYTSDAGRFFDDGNPSNSKKTAVTEPKREESPEQKYKKLEIKISNVMEQSILLSTAQKPDFSTALLRAKEASSLDRTLMRMREQNAGIFTHNFDLTYCVLFNLANLYSLNDMYMESLNTYILMTKNKMFPNVNRLKINMGNIYFQLGMYPKAIKMYRMALDQVPNNQKELRLKITHNIGILFIKMGQYSDAAASFEFIMAEKGDSKSGLHLILCYYALGDADKMKRAFFMLLEVPVEYEEERNIGTISNPAIDYIHDVINVDELQQYELKLKYLAEKNILIAANLISNVIEDNYINDGYTWCVDTIKHSNYPSLASELDLNKAVIYLKQNEISASIEALKIFEKKEPVVAINAAINLTFIFILKKDIQTAEKYAESARRLDTYNPAVFINSGVCEMLRDNIELAKTLFQNALEIDAIFFEALYNMGLIFKRMGDYETAVSYFRKIHANLGHEQNAQVIYQLGSLYELLGDRGAALEWYLQLLSVIQLDSGLFQKIGELYEQENDRQQAYHYNLEAYRVNPINNSVINWIGSHFIELQVAEKAITFYAKATLNNPNDPYFMLRVAGCYRRAGNPQKSMQIFLSIHEEFPQNLDALRALLHLTKTQGLMDDYEKYLNEYHRLQKVQETRQRLGSSRPTTSNSSGNGNQLRSASKTSHRDQVITAETITTMLSRPNSRLGTTNILNSHYEHELTGNDGTPKHYQRLQQPVYNYTDPLGPAPERPRTTGKLHNKVVEEDEFTDDDISPEELLPL